MATSRDGNPWVVIPKPNPQARLRLFCFPYAGGGASLFRPWAEEMPPLVEICAIQPPGRESRFSEPRFTSLAPLVAALDAALDPLLRPMPFAFFGHSLGAIASFELARALRRRQGPLPAYLFVSAHRAPQLPPRHTDFHDLTDEQFITRLGELNGIPAGVAENADLMEVMLPLLRADVGIAETYVATAEPPLPIPIAAFGGVMDAEVSRDDLTPWKEQTSAAFSVRMLPGDHFFFAKQRMMLYSALLADLRAAQLL
jgi:medium-chain acyl-[acyl-carrier-protein] hydrolase